MARDIHKAFGEIYSGAQKSAQTLGDAVIGDQLRDLQRQALSTQRKNNASAVPFCYRIDAVWIKDTFKIIEINPDNVGGVEDSFELRQLYRRYLPEENPPPLPAERIAMALKRLHPGEPGRIVYTDAECRMCAYRLSAILAKLGVAATPVHLNDLQDDDIKYTWIYRHLLYEDLFVHDFTGTVPTPTARAVEYFLNLAIDGDVAIYNPISDRLVFDKRFMAVDSLPFTISDEAKSSIKKWVAHTELISSTDARQLQLFPPEDKVIKMAKGMGGRGVYLPGMHFGDQNIGDNYWIKQDYLRQEQIEVESSGGWKPVYNLVHGIYVVNGDFAGDHLRVSSNPVVNVASGGGMIPAL